MSNLPSAFLLLCENKRSRSADERVFDERPTRCETTRVGLGVRGRIEEHPAGRVDVTKHRRGPKKPEGVSELTSGSRCRAPGALMKVMSGLTVTDGNGGGEGGGVTDDCSQLNMSRSLLSVVVIIPVFSERLFLNASDS